MDTTIQDWAGRKAARIAEYQATSKVALAACNHLQAVLKAKYGKRAGDMRYKPAETVEIAEAMKAYLEASERRQTAWLAYMRQD